MLQLRCASGLIFIYFETLVQINLLNTVECGPSLVYMLQFLLNFKLMAKNVQKRNKLDDSALFRTQSYTGITEICYFKFLPNVCIRIRWFMSLWGLQVYETHIGRIYPLELYNVQKGGLKHHQPCLFLKAIP